MWCLKLAANVRKWSGKSEISFWGKILIEFGFCNKIFSEI
jgi:hypothetical protein